MRNLVLILWAILLLLSPDLATATAQKPDILILNEKEFALNTNPLKSYLEANPGSLPQPFLGFLVRSTANWRGYVATWEVLNGRLNLRKVEVRYPGPINNISESVLKDVLPKMFDKDGPIPATWYSGALIVPDGKVVDYVHMGYGSSYDHYQVFRVKDGNVLEQLSLSQEEFESYKLEKFRTFMKTEEFNKAFNRVKSQSSGFSDQEAVGFIANFYSEQYLSR